MTIESDNADCRVPSLKHCQARITRWTFDKPQGEVLWCERCGVGRAEIIKPSVRVVNDYASSTTMSND